MKHLPTAALAFACVCSMVHAEPAGLNLTIDSASKTFAFEDLDTGTLFYDGFAGITYARWSFTTNILYVNGMSDAEVSFTPGTVIAVAAAGPADEIMNPEVSLYITSASPDLNGDSYAMLSLNIDADYREGVSQVTGLSEAYSYASFSPTAQAIFESLDGQALLLTDGADFSPINIVVTPVPEPASASLLAGALALGATCGLRRRR